MLGRGCGTRDGIRLGSSLRGAHRLLPSFGCRPRAHHSLSTASDGGGLGDSTGNHGQGKLRRAAGRATRAMGIGISVHRTGNTKMAVTHLILGQREQHSECGGFY